MGNFLKLNCLLSSLAFVLFFGLITIFVLPSLLVFLLIYPFVKYPQDRFQQLASVIYKIFFILMPRIELNVSKREDLPKSAVYISSHQSNLDYPILGCFIPRYLIMTTLKFKKIPFISMVGELIGVRYLDHLNLDRIAKVYEEFRVMLLENRNVVFFAEGTRHNGPYLGRFKKGAFRLAMELNKPIVPIVIEGSGDILTKGRFCFSSSQKNIIDVTVLSAIYPQDFSDEKALMEYAYECMQTAKEELITQKKTRLDAL
jgi:1-acyl-sn-glycerol-3-phosphate acyltransferase